jgi:eukaryotic-like serine/threonine-protein kinase
MPAPYAFGSFRFEATGLLTRNGKQVHLTPKEAAVLCLLLENAGNVVEKEQFRKTVWPEIRPDQEGFDQLDNCLKRSIATLRKRLGDPKNGSQHIRTIPTRGYLFAKETLIPDRLRMVVLPFQGEYSKRFIEVLTEDVTMQLSRLNAQRLTVIAFSTAKQYENTKQPIGQIGKDLGVGHVLVGTVRRSGNNFRVFVELILATDGSQLWSGTYERRQEDIRVFLRELSQDVARNLQIKVVSHEHARLDYVARVVPEAYKKYVHGRYLWNKRTPESLQHATQHFEDVIALDPSFEQAHSALADCFAVIASQSWISPKEACAKAKSAATAAISLDKTFAEPHAALGFVLVFERHWPEAEREFQQALKLNANYATAHHWYSFYLAARNRLREAIQQMKIAQNLDQLSRMINTNVGTMLYWARDYDSAIEQYDEALRLESDFWYAHWMRGLAHDEKGQYRQAAADQRRALRLCPDQSSLLLASLARTFALAGDHKGARDELKKASQAASHSCLPHYHIAVAHAALGDREAAFRTLLESSFAHEMWIAFVQVDPKIDSLRNDRRYARLLRTLSL